MDNFSTMFLSSCRIFTQKVKLYNSLKVLVEIRTQSATSLTVMGVKDEIDNFPFSFLVFTVLNSNFLIAWGHCTFQELSLSV